MFAGSATRRSTGIAPGPSTEQLALEPIPRKSRSQDHEPPDDPLSLSTSPSSHSSTSLLEVLTYSSLVLENSGNLARDHLSMERTWLAYMRTSLLFAGTGVALVQLYAITLTEEPSLQTETTHLLGSSTTMRQFARPLGETIVIFALCVLAIAVRRYFKVQRAIMDAIFPTARTTVVLVSASLAILTAVTFGVILTLPG